MGVVEKFSIWWTPKEFFFETLEEEFFMVW
jgi:hypothetical protein